MTEAIGESYLIRRGSAVCDLCGEDKLTTGVLASVPYLSNPYIKN
jgi:hypothetical protein